MTDPGLDYACLVIRADKGHAFDSQFLTAAAAAAAAAADADKVGKFITLIHLPAPSCSKIPSFTLAVTKAWSAI